MTSSVHALHNLTGVLFGFLIGMYGFKLKLVGDSAEQYNISSSQKPEGPVPFFRFRPKNRRVLTDIKPIVKIEVEQERKYGGTGKVYGTNS